MEIFITFLKATVLGLVQGVTEFLPISSTAHLKVVPVVLGWGDPGVAFTAVIQLGSIFAVLSYFWQDLVSITRGSITAIRNRKYQSYEFKLAVGILLGTVPIILGGLAIKKFMPDYDNAPLRSLGAIATASIFMSLLLATAEKVGKKFRNLDNLQLKDGWWMGVWQALALIPGVSRSGATLTAGLFMGMERQTATRFSFLLGIPAITLAGVVEGIGLIKHGIDTDWFTLIVGLISSAIFSYLAIAWLLKFFQTHSSWLFVWYRLVFGSLIWVAIGLGWLSNV
ncbi:MAG: undecaprenyl-diphosphate phosphatase [Pseudanabaenaceae cyanobacterium]